MGVLVGVLVDELVGVLVDELVDVLVDVLVGGWVCRGITVRISLMSQKPKSL